MGDYLVESAGYDRDGLGIERKDIHLAVNVAGYYSEEQCSQGHLMSVSCPEGRRDYLFCYIAQGGLCLKIDGSESVVQNGVLLIPPQVPYQYYSQPVNDCMELYWIHFTGSYAAQYLKECGLNDGYFFSTERTEELSVSVQTIAREMTFQQIAYDKVTQSLLVYVLALTARYHVSEQHTSRNIDARMQKVIEYIYLWYARELSIKEMASVAALSVSRFSSLFKQTFGLNPLQYIINYRIKRACDLLRHTEYSVSTVAEKVGFSDPLYFSRVFKKQMKVNPTAYRQKMNPDLFMMNLVK